MFSKINVSKLFLNLKLFLKGFLVVALSTVFVVVISANIPQVHSNYIRNSVGQKVVEITLDSNPHSKSGGTGFHVKARSGKTYILTNQHICVHSTNGFVFVKQPNSDRKMPKRIIEQYIGHDLCLIEPIEGVSGLSIGSEPKIGEIVGLVGHPRLAPLTLSRGEIIANPVIDIGEINVPYELCRGVFGLINDPFLNFMGLTSFCVTSYPTHQATYISYGGNSGSPVVNFYGNLVGVHFAGMRGVVNDGYMVPISFVNEFLYNY